MKMVDVNKLSIGLFVVCLYVSQDMTNVLCATVRGDDQTGVLGDSPLILTCAFTVDADETAFSMLLKRRRQKETSFRVVALYNIATNQALFVDLSLRDRAVLIVLDVSTNLKFNNLECNDTATYMCDFAYSKDKVIQTVEDDMNLVVEAKPLSPVTIPPGYNPNNETFVEDEELEVRCEADVGLPAGTFKWFGYKAGIPTVDLTLSANDGQPTNNSGPRYCAFSRESTLKLNLTRDHDGFVIRCVVSQPTLGPPPAAEDSCDAVPCKQTDPMEVEYPVRQEDIIVSSNPSRPEYVTGSQVTMKCTVDGKPDPYFRWEKENNENVSLEGQDTWTLHNLQLGDGGTYWCFANSHVSGMMYNASTSICINVVETTTSTASTIISSTTAAQAAIPSGQALSVGSAQAVGIGVMLALAGVCLIAVCIVRKKVPACLSGDGENPNTKASDTSCSNISPDQYAEFNSRKCESPPPHNESLRKKTYNV